MDENLHKDSLENLFRKNLEDAKLENRDAAPNDWDMPSDQVWEGIGEALNPPAPKGLWLSTKMQLLATAAGLLLLVGVFTCFRSYQKQLSSLSQQVEQLTEQQKNSSEKVNPTTPATTPVETPTDDAAKPSTKPSSPAPANTTSNANNSTTPTTNLANTSAAPSQSNTVEANTNPTSLTDNSQKIAANASPQATEANSDPKQDPEITYPPSTIANASSPSEEIPRQEQSSLPRTSIASLPPLPQLSIANLAATPAAPTLPSGADPIIAPFRAIGNTGFYAGVFYAPSVTFIKFTRRRPNIPNGFDVEKSKLTGFQGFKLGYQWNNRWALEVEGRYGSSSIKTSHDIELEFAKQREREVRPGSFQSDYSYAIPTAYGEVDSDISIFRESGTELDDKAALRLKIEAEHHIQLASIPVVLKYRTGQGPLRLSFRGGVASNFFLKESFEIVATNFERLGISSDPIRTRPGSKRTRKVSFDALAGIGVDFQPTPNWRFSLEPTYALGLRPLFKNARQKIYPRSLSVSAGINYQF